MVDITNPNSLWKDYDAAALPLKVTELSAAGKKEHVRDMYFDGFATFDGKARAYLRIHENPQAKGVILYLTDVKGDKTGNTAQAMYERGYTVAVLDYLGKRNGGERFTIYPRSISHCNCYGTEKFDTPSDALSSRWYVWACLARKATLLIKQLYDNTKIFALGKGIGGSTVYKLAAFDDGITACATLLNIIPDVDGSGNQMINYRAALDVNAYSTLTKLPLLMAVCSNDKDGSLDEMSELADITASLKCFRIVERAFTDGIATVYDQVDRFFDKFANRPGDLPMPEIKAKNSENRLYFDINIHEPEGYNHKDISLYAAFAIDDPAIRNWTKIKSLGLGGTEYIARLTVLQENKPVYAFVNITDERGNVSSSCVKSVVPKSLGILPQTVAKRRLIYDGSMDTDVWASPAGGDVSVKSGPFDITGITSSVNTLVTFKPGDYLYKAEKDSMLQIMIYAKSGVNVSVSDESERYNSTTQITQSDGWQKITLSHNDFKSASGPLSDFSVAVMLSFTSDDEFIVSSVLWV